MKITRADTEIVSLPIEPPIATAIHQIRSVGCVLLRLRTDEGLVGEAYLFALNGARIKAFDEMLRGLAERAVGRDPHYVAGIWEDIWGEINPSGQRGVTISALSTIDTACWDLIGKSAGKPLHHIFGACRDRVKTYASGGLWLSQSIEELCAQAEGFVGEGFRAMKMRVGKAKIGEDVERVRAVREAVGGEVELLVDANQAFSPKHAIRLAGELAEFDLGWLEEPVAVQDLDGQARVTAAVDIPIAAGESEYTRFAMRDLIQVGACDVLMPDLQRVGGLTEMLRVAALAGAHNIGVSTHIFTEQSLCFAGAAANCISVEYMPWFSRLFNEELELVEGELVIPGRAGVGFSFVGG